MIVVPKRKKNQTDRGRKQRENLNNPKSADCCCVYSIRVKRKPLIGFCVSERCLSSISGWFTVTFESNFLERLFYSLSPYIVSSSVFLLWIAHHQTLYRDGIHGPDRVQRYTLTQSNFQRFNEFLSYSLHFKWKSLKTLNKSNFQNPKQIRRCKRLNGLNEYNKNNNNNNNNKTSIFIEWIIK